MLKLQINPYLPLHETPQILKPLNTADVVSVELLTHSVTQPCPEALNCSKAQRPGWYLLAIRCPSWVWGCHSSVQLSATKPLTPGPTVGWGQSRGWKWETAGWVKHSEPSGQPCAGEGQEHFIPKANGKNKFPRNQSCRRLSFCWKLGLISVELGKLSHAQRLGWL